MCPGGAINGFTLLPDENLKGLLKRSFSCRTLCVNVLRWGHHSVRVRSSDAGAFLRTGPPTTALRISVMTLCGRELASMDADGAWTKPTSARADSLGRPPRAARLLYGGDMVSGETSLSTFGVEDGACLQLVLECRGGDLLLTASI